MIYTDTQIEQYLARIEYKGDLALNLSTLRSLQLAHLTHIPYENLDILRSVPLSLQAEDLFEKIILRRRGGYCFELNGLYSNLLKSLGFTVTNFLGRFIFEEGIQKRTHRVLKVEAEEGSFICDVGIRRESTRTPLLFCAGKIQHDGMNEYKLEEDPFYGWVLWQREENKNWKRIYGFTEEPQLDMDYVVPSFYSEKHPNSQFTKGYRVSIFKEDCQIGLVDHRLQIYRHAHIEEDTELNETEIDLVLAKIFGIFDDTSAR